MQPSSGIRVIDGEHNLLRETTSENNNQPVQIHEATGCNIDGTEVQPASEIQVINAGMSNTTSFSNTDSPHYTTSLNTGIPMQINAARGRWDTATGMQPAREFLVNNGHPNTRGYTSFGSRGRRIQINGARGSNTGIDKQPASDNCVIGREPTPLPYGSSEIDDKPDAQLKRARRYNKAGQFHVFCGVVQIVLGIGLIILRGPKQHLGPFPVVGFGMMNGVFSIATGLIGITSRFHKIYLYLALSIEAAPLSLSCAVYCLVWIKILIRSSGEIEIGETEYDVPPMELISHVILWSCFAATFLCEVAVSFVGAIFSGCAFCDDRTKEDDTQPIWTNSTASPHGSQIDLTYENPANEMNVGSTVDPESHGFISESQGFESPTSIDDEAGRIPESHTLEVRADVNSDPSLQAPAHNRIEVVV